MKRSDFLKSMFGAAVVVAMPPLVVKQIDTLPDPEVKPKKGIITPQNIETTLFDGVCFLYDGDELIAKGKWFNISMKRDVIPMQYPFSMDSDGWQHYMLGDTYIDIDSVIIDRNINSLDLTKSYSFIAINNEWGMHGATYINKHTRISNQRYKVELILAGAMAMQNLIKG